jgi:hypothetical protein
MKVLARETIVVLAATTKVILALTACGGGSVPKEIKARPLPEEFVA